MPPFGHSTQLRVFVDPDLLQYDEVWAAAGTIIASYRAPFRGLLVINREQIQTLFGDREWLRE